MSQKKFNPAWTIPTQQWTDWELNDNITVSIDVGDTLNDIGDIDIDLPFLADDITTTVTVDGLPVDESVYETGVQLNFGIDKTLEDDMETAQLILRGICPKCRKDDGDHEWDCPAWSGTLQDTTFSTSQNISFGTPYGPTVTIDTIDTTNSTIHVGNNTLTQEKLDKLDALLDRVENLDIDKLIKFVDKLPDE